MRKNRAIRVAVAMSGGVDSSVAAALMLEQGYQVEGLTMDFNASSGRKARWSCSADAIDDARRVARLLNIPHATVPVRADIERRVIRDFMDEYAAGRTPNPCVRCNAFVKFGVLLDNALKRGARFLVTGHYARVVRARRGFLLKTGRDRVKDQSYFLYRLKQSQLAHVLFPLGGLTKAMVREHARRFSLPVAEKPGSQEICFLSGEDYRAFLRRSGAATTGRRGDIVDSCGNVLGRHQGLVHYTIGQRGGLGIARGYPLYVIGLDAGSDRVVVGSRDEACRKECLVRGVHWIGASPKKTIVAAVKIRYNHVQDAATIFPRGKTARVVFRRPQFAITPGQSAVFYSGETVLGGGIIR